MVEFFNWESSNVQFSFDSATSQSTDHSFKPMPSPRVTRSWRPPAKIPSPTSAAASAQSAAYPSAIGLKLEYNAL